MATEYKIYTKGGDKGETSLLGGTRVPKYHDRIEAYGTLDELNSFLGIIRDQDIPLRFRDLIIEIQSNIFTAESHLAADRPESVANLPAISEEDILKLEQEIDEMNTHLEPLKNFILPGGHPVVSYCHISRTICRRAERLTIKLAEKHAVDSLIIKYLNRLSDYLFVLARRMAKTFDADEIAWKPRK
ncbi:MAG: cob(I)yrinic acid a,c-diamide adenosyltransferase [Bacteroidales bacterium]|nr:cob(I)yrinic acid a,c-diamide adenosyltransferase [Bacteroidales bacterium]